MKYYEDTHRCFKVATDWDHSTRSWPAAEMCRKYLGDNDPYQRLQDRAWFTFPEGEVWIRHDCLDSVPATWFGLTVR